MCGFHAIMSLLSMHADCQSPILAIHSYKQRYLNSKLHSNNIDVIKPAATPADNKETKANKKPSIKKNKARNNSRSSFDINFTIKCTVYCNIRCTI